MKPEIKLEKPNNPIRLSEMIQVRVSQKMMQAVYNESQRLGVKPTEVVRMAILNSIPHQLPSKPLEEDVIIKYFTGFEQEKFNDLG